MKDLKFKELIIGVIAFMVAIPSLVYGFAYLIKFLVEVF